MRYSERITHSTAPGKVFFLIVFLFLLLAISAFGQSREEKKMRVKAVKAINAGRFQEAQNIYYDLLRLDPENPDYNYEMGLSIYEEGVKRGKAAPYFEKAILYTEQDTLPDMYLFAGKAEQYAGNFDIAIDYFETYMALMRKMEDISPDLLEENVMRYIEMCENGKVQFENNLDYVRIENLGKQINSVFPDYSPVVARDESIILFTSRRDNTTGGGKDSDDKPYEDIYYSLNIDGTWTPSTNFDSTSRYMNRYVNTDDHDAAITYAADESQMYIYREEDVWISTLDQGVWTVPVRDNSRTNTEKGFEPSVFITQDQQTMFVVSELGSGFGGRDIYITHKNNEGKWNPLKSLGRTINTKYDEDAPFLTPDGNTLYFASKGHNSMGDYDIFKSVLDEHGNWGIPENLGPPINTPGHDRYFVTSDDGAVGYYASDRDGGYGETDIYRIILDCKAVSATIIRGVVFSDDLNKPIGATISIFESPSGKFINNYNADAKDGSYEMRLKTETTYKFRIAANGYLPHSGEFTVPKQCDYFSLFQEIKIDNMEDSNGRVYAQRAFINNAFFNIDQKVEEDFADIEPDKLAEKERDSLRLMVANNYNPIELTNYVKLIDILDPNGTRIGSEIIGEKSVATIQARDEIKAKFNDNIVKADQYFYNNNLPEARANYIVANVIDGTEDYPKQQMALIDDKLVDAPFDALLATIEEVDESTLIVPEEGELADNSSFIIPTETPAIEAGEVLPEENQEYFNMSQLEADAAAKPTSTGEESQLAYEQKATEAADVESEVENVAMIEETDPIMPPQPDVEEISPQPQENEVALQPEQAAEQVATQEQIPPPAPEPLREKVTSEVQMAQESQTPAAVAKEEKMTGKTTVQQETKGEELIVFRNILFDFDKSDLREASIKELNRILGYMNTKNEVELRIDGHADWIGTDVYNLALSERRAKAAYAYLLEQGLADQRITYQYFGEAVPIAPNANEDGSDNPEGRQLNRRCEFQLNAQGTAQNVVLKF